MLQPSLQPGLTDRRGHLRARARQAQQMPAPPLVEAHADSGDRGRCKTAPEPVRSIHRPCGAAQRKTHLLRLRAYDDLLSSSNFSSRLLNGRIGVQTMLIGIALVWGIPTGCVLATGVAALVSKRARASILRALAG